MFNCFAVKYCFPKTWTKKNETKKNWKESPLKGFGAAPNWVRLFYEDITKRCIAHQLKFNLVAFQTPIFHCSFFHTTFSFEFLCLIFINIPCKCWKSNFLRFEMFQSFISTLMNFHSNTKLLSSYFLVYYFLFEKYEYQTVNKIYFRNKFVDFQKQPEPHLYKRIFMYTHNIHKTFDSNISYNYFKNSNFSWCFIKAMLRNSKKT